MEAMFTKGLLKASNARQQEQEPLEELEELRYQCQVRDLPTKSVPTVRLWQQQRFH